MSNSASLESRLAFLEFDAGDRHRLEALAPVVAKHADDLVAAFYRHLMSFAPTRRLLADAATRDRLLRVQKEYLLSLTPPALDDDYVAERRAIGCTHVRIGLEPSWYAGAYALYLRLLMPLIEEQFGDDRAAAEQAQGSLLKVIVLDHQLALDAYIARREERLEFATEELAAASRQLERQVETRNEELRVTTARARAAEELASVAAIVAGLAHEIGTPMGVIAGHAELLESSVSDERGRDRLRTIREQIDRISNIIQTLLNMARPGDHQRQPVELPGVIEHTLVFLTEKFRSRGIEVATDLPKRATVHGSHEKLQQLFLNLFLNAADAMPSGGRLEVGVAAREDDWIVEVRDDGEGMDEASRRRAFEPFFTTKPPGRGSGLGLMVCHGIASDHGGSLEIESAPGQGTTVRVALPDVQSAST